MLSRLRTSSLRRVRSLATFRTSEGVHETAFGHLRHSIPMGRHPKIGGLSFDYLGTSVGYRGNLFYKAVAQTFLARGITLTRFEMTLDNVGGNKYGYITQLMGLTKTLLAWKDIYNRYPNQGDIDSMIAAYNANQLEALKTVQPVLGFLDALMKVVELYNPAVTFNSSFNQAQVDVITKMLKTKGLTNIKVVSRQEVEVGRPEPWMVNRASEKGRIFPPYRQVVFGDTTLDIKAARNAGAIAVGVTDSSSQMITTPIRSSEVEIENIIRRKMYEAGAHYVISKWQELPETLRRVNDHRTPINRCCA